MESETCRAEKWKTDYLAGDIEREGNTVVHKETVYHGPPLGNSDLLNFYYVDSLDRLVKSAFDLGGMEERYQTFISEEPEVPKISPIAFLVVYTKSMMVIGLPVYLISGKLSAALAASAVMTIAPAIMAKKELLKEYRSDTSAWNKYKEFLDGVYKT